MNFKRKITGRDIVGFALLGLSLILLGKSVMLCFSNDIWYDELFTVGLAEHSYGELVRLTAADVHPPLYYCMVKLFVDLCKLIIPGAGTIIPAKIVSVLPYFILLIYAVTLIRKRFGLFTGGLFLFCVTAMPQLSAYTVEMRMYGWALLFVTAAFLHAYALARGASHLHATALVLYGLAAAYTQYFACVAVGMVYLCLLLVFWFQDRRRIKEWLVYVGISVIAYVPWLFALAGQLSAVSENYWILPLTWRSLGGCVKFLMKPAFANETVNTVLAVLLFAAYIGLWCRWLSKLCHNRKVCGRFFLATAGIAVLAGLVAFGFAASFLIRPIFVYRYMIPAAGCFWLGFALCLNEILCKLKAPRRAVGVTLTLLVIIIGLRDYRAFMGEEEYKIRLMAQTQEALAMIGPQDSVLYNFDQVQAVTGYYLPQTTARFLWRAEGEKLIQEITSPCGTVEDTAQIRRMLEKTREKKRDVQDAGGNRNVWFIGSFNSREDIVEEWRNAGLKVEELGSFLLERYWFNLYKIS